MDAEVVRWSQSTLTKEQVRQLRQMQWRVTELIVTPQARSQLFSFTERSQAVEVKIELSRCQPVVILFQELLRLVTELETGLLKFGDDAPEGTATGVRDLQRRLVEKAEEVKAALEELDRTADAAYSHIEGVQMLNQYFAGKPKPLSLIADVVGLSVVELNELSMGNVQIQNCALATDLADAIGVERGPFVTAWGLKNCDTEGDAEALDRLMRKKRVSNADMGSQLGISAKAVSSLRVSGREHSLHRSYYQWAFQLLR